MLNYLTIKPDILLDYYYENYHIGIEEIDIILEDLKDYDDILYISFCFIYVIFKKLFLEL